MKRIVGNLLAFLAAILFPLLIWVGIFVIIRPSLVRAARRIGTLAIVLLSGVFAPFLIWLGLFVAIKERYQEWKIKRSPSRTVAEIMEAAGVTVDGTSVTEQSPRDVIFNPRPLMEIRGMIARAGI
jgi:hypothetical protein